MLQKSKKEKSKAGTSTLEDLQKPVSLARELFRSDSHQNLGGRRFEEPSSDQPILIRLTSNNEPIPLLYKPSSRADQGFYIPRSAK